MTIYSLSGTKGGIGKSTIAVHLCGHLIERGRRVTLVDADPQRSSSQWAGFALPDMRLECALTGDELIDGLDSVRADADDVVIDLAGTSTDLHRLAMLRSDVVIVPTGTSLLDISATMAAASLVRQAHDIRNNNKPDAVVVVNRYQAQLKTHQEALDVCQDVPGMRTAKTTIGLRNAFAVAVKAGQLVWDLPSDTGNKAAIDEMRNLMSEIAP